MGNLPTSKRLSQRVSTIQPLCRRCKLTDEDDEHCFLTCDISRATWFASQLHIRTDQVTETIPDFIRRLSHELSMSDFAYAATLLWALWEHRNSWIFNAKPSTPALILQRTNTNLLQSSLHPTTPPKQKASPPPQPPNLLANRNDLQVFTDASWNLHFGGWGFHIHRDNSLLLYACGSFSSPCPLHAETTALLKAAEALFQLLQDSTDPPLNVHFYSDCKVLIDALITQSSITDWRVLKVYSELQQQCRRITQVTYNHIHRIHNKEAHALAATGYTLAEPITGYQYPTFKPP